MARRSFRDRFWSPPVARAVTAPSSILLAGGAAAVGIVATAPLSLPLGVIAGLVAGGLAYGGRVLAAVPRNTSGTAGIDPFAVQEPWRRFVTDALAARRRFDEAVRAMDAGPLRDRLTEIGDRLDDGLQETWRVARRGHTLSGARSRVDAGALEAELAEAEAQQAANPDPRAAQVAEAVRSQLASTQRMQGVIEDAVTTLRLLDARLDESVTRAIELSTGTGPAAHASAVGGDVEGIVSEMETLRLALDEAGTASGGPAAGGAQSAPSP